MDDRPAPRPFVTSLLAALALGMVFILIRNKGVMTLQSIVLVFGAGLGFWIFGVIAILSSKPENKLRNALAAVFVAFAMNLMTAVRSG